MRAFTKQEKWILRKTAELKVNKENHTICLGDICVAFLDSEYIHIHLSELYDSYDIEFCFNCDVYDPGYEQVDKKQKEIERKIIDAIFLLKYLKENRLLFEITGNNSDKEFDITGIDYNTDRHFSKKSNFDKATEKFIVDLLVNKQYFIRQEFIDFVHNGFKTIDYKLFTKSQLSAWTGIIIAFLIGLGSILLNIDSERKAIDRNRQQIIYMDSCLNEMKGIYNMNLQKDSLLLNSLHNKLNIIINKTDKIKTYNEVTPETK